MDINIPLKRDSANSYIGELALNVFSCGDTYRLELKNPDRTIYVDKEDFKKAINIF